MGLKAAWASLTSGEFKDAFNNVLVSDEDIALHQEVANAQQAIVQRQYNDGLISETKASDLYSEIARNAYIYNPDTIGPEGTPADVFAADIKERAAKFTDVTLKIVPWQVWLVLGIVLVVWAWPYLGAIFSRLSVGKK